MQFISTLILASSFFCGVGATTFYLSFASESIRAGETGDAYTKGTATSKNLTVNEVSILKNGMKPVLTDIFRSILTNCSSPFVNCEIVIDGISG